MAEQKDMVEKRKIGEYIKEKCAKKKKVEESDPSLEYGTFFATHSSFKT